MEAKQPSFWDGLEDILNLKRFQDVRCKLCDDAREVFFQFVEAGELRWKRSGKNLLDLATQVTANNLKGEPVSLSVILSWQYRDEGPGYLSVDFRSEADGSLFGVSSGQQARINALYQSLTGEGSKAQG